MYNDRRYSLARYSVNQEKKTIEIAESFFDTMGAVTGTAIPVDLRERYRDTLHGSARGTVSVISSFSESSSLFSKARVSADVLTRAIFFDSLQAAAYGQKDTPAALTVSDELSSQSWASKNIPVHMDFADSFTASAAGSKDIQASFKVSDVLTTMSEATSQTMETATFDLTIPPGGELRIDSELFSVLLNGENALHTQSGDWINISRELLRLIIESASGGRLQGQLIYTERYL